GGDPASIRLALEGSGKLAMDPDGDLVLEAESGPIRSHRPVIYQEVRGIRHRISGGYRLASGNQVAFEVGPYDHSAALVIDPAISYATNLGGVGDDVGRSIAVDAAGNA